MENLQRVLMGEVDNYIAPFLWVHGEEEARIRQYMNVIHSAGIGAVCVESRPHPDFCGPKWWADMDVILSEAKKLKMKVWILDDKHFPTGNANGAMNNAPHEFRRCEIAVRILDCSGKKRITVSEGMLKRAQVASGILGKITRPKNKPDPDVLLGVYAARTDTKKYEPVELSRTKQNGKLQWDVPEGNWHIYIVHKTTRGGINQDSINMMDEASVKLLIDAVYEKHYEHYRDEFGKTIQGFFSDEPELGNGTPYKSKPLGCGQDQPWSQRMEGSFKEKYGENYAAMLPLLFDNELPADDRVALRYQYMDTVSWLVSECFSKQVGDWCRARGVEHIGHLNEDANQHARTGSGMGHFFRAMSGNGMSGLDAVSNTLLPGNEDEYTENWLTVTDGEFMHFALSKMATSAAAVDPKKNGMTMVEIFGNYGWGEGTRLEKYLVDHFLVRGVNYFIPHAFTLKKFPDSDCPPHFYADGNDALYRHFGCLMGYTNRMCTLFSGMKRISAAAILYHAEAEWMGDCMMMQKPARELTEHQKEFDILPQDEVIAGAKDGSLIINGNQYPCLVIPQTQYITEKLANTLFDLLSWGYPVAFVDSLPEGVLSEDTGKILPLSQMLSGAEIVPLCKTASWVEAKSKNSCILTGDSTKMRIMSCACDGLRAYMVTNEGKEVYSGGIRIPDNGDELHYYCYDGWRNRLVRLKMSTVSGSGVIDLEVYPCNSKVILASKENLDAHTEVVYKKPQHCENLSSGWRRSVCTALAYPKFSGEKQVSIPDDILKEKPHFAGIVAYERKINLEKDERAVIEISDAHEGVELFVNGVSAGITVAEPYRYDITSLTHSGVNRIRIEVASTLGNKRMKKGLIELLSAKGEKGKAGITGKVLLFTNRLHNERK